VSFNLVCSGPGVGNVQVTSGGVKSGSPGCNSSWVKFFTNDSDTQLIVIKLTSGSGAYVSWTLFISANN
jgi:hypothetical protein